MQLPRASGILLHPTSLPGRYGIGDLGPEAHAFVDLLAETGQTWWQILPLGPIGYGGSPYQSPSSFAGNPLLISLDRLADRGWLDAGGARRGPGPARRPGRFRRGGRAQVEMAAPGVPGIRGGGGRSGLRGVPPAAPLVAGRLRVLPGPPRRPRRQAVVRVGARAGRPRAGGLRPMARAGSPRASASTSSSSTPSRPSGRTCARPARTKGIQLIGDVPIFVAHDSADVWAHPDLYHLDEHGRPLFMAGVPPDYFSEDGQLWGNPLYRWEAHAKDGFAWWLLRLRSLLERVDLIRIDHFRGFEAYWEVPAGSKTAATGRWVPAPGRDVLQGRPQGDGLRAADRRGPRRDHPRGRGAARRVRPARHARPPVRLRRRPGLGEAPAAPLHQQLHRLYRHARQRHDLRLVPLQGGDDHPAARGGRGGARVRPRSTRTPTAGRSTGT